MYTSKSEWRKAKQSNTLLEIGLESLKQRNLHANKECQCSNKTKLNHKTIDLFAVVSLVISLFFLSLSKLLNNNVHVYEILIATMHRSAYGVCKRLSISSSQAHLIFFLILS